jgi:hypothetical protein
MAVKRPPAAAARHVTNTEGTNLKIAAKIRADNKKIVVAMTVDVTMPECWPLPLKDLANRGAFARPERFSIVGEYYDAAVSGADPVDQRPGFAEMLQRLAADGAKTIIVESPDRFARDLAVQLAGHDMRRALGIAIIPASAPDFFTEDTPTAVLVRQVLGAIAQFEKATAVAKLAAARKRKREREGRCEGEATLCYDSRRSILILYPRYSASRRGAH